jgi:hypothetical protein
MRRKIRAKSRSALSVIQLQTKRYETQTPRRTMVQVVQPISHPSKEFMLVGLIFETGCPDFAPCIEIILAFNSGHLHTFPKRKPTRNIALTCSNNIVVIRGKYAISK